MFAALWLTMDAMVYYLSPKVPDPAFSQVLLLELSAFRPDWLRPACEKKMERQVW
jgi:hypothetical protein